MLQNGGTSGKTWVLAGGLTIQADAVNSFGTNGCIFLNGNGPILVTASISGSGAICLGTPSAGTSGNNIILAGDLSGFTGKILTTDHHITTPLTVSNATDQTISGVISILDAFTKKGPAKLTLIGTNTYAGVTTNSSGTLLLAGNEIGVTNTTVVSSGATLQLQANSTNIVSGVSYALGNTTAANIFTSGCTIQFRSDSSVTFNGGNNVGGVGSGTGVATNNWDVNQLTGAGANNTLTFAPSGFSVFNSLFNITGGNGYTLALGPMNGINTGGTLTLNPASGVGLSVNGITGNASGGLTVQGAGNTTIGAAITATTTLTKQGAGTLTLSGANSFTGSTLVQTGIVALASGATLASTNISINAGATLDVGALGSALALNTSQVLGGNGTVKGSVDTSSGGLIYPGGKTAAGTLTINTNLTLSMGGTVNFDLAHNTAIGGGTNDLIVVGGNLNVAGATTLSLNFLNGSPATGTYTLIQYGTFSGDISQISLPSNPRYTLALNNNTGSKTIELLVSGVAANLVWQGDGVNNYWDNTGANQDWTNSASTSLDYFYDGDNVTFTDTGSDSPAINLFNTLAPGSMVVNATQNYDFSGSGGITGSGGLTKSGSGTLILETANSYTGATVVSSGTLQIGNSGASGSLGSGAVTNNGTIAFNRTDGVSVANDLHGAGAFVVNSGNITPTSANNDFTGSVTINNGGIIYAANTNALGTTAGGTTVNSGGQFYITANVNFGTEALSLAGVGGDSNGALRKGGAGASTYSGALTLTANSTIGVDSGATLTLNSPLGLAGAFALTKNGSGTLALSSSNSYSGGTVLSTGVININTNNALGTGPVTATTSGHFLIADGLNVTNSFTASAVSPGAATGFIMVGDNTNGTVTTVSGPLAFNTTAATGGHFIGTFSSGYLNVSGPITMPASTPLIVRDGKVRFANSASSLTEIQVRANTTSVGVNNGVATNAVLDLAGNGTAFLDLNGFNQKLAGMKNTVTAANAGLGYVTNSSASAATLTLDLGTGNTYSSGSSLVGNLSLVLQSGTQVFTNNNRYTGNTTVNGGTLEIAQATLATNSTVSIASGAVLQLDFSVTNRVGALVLNGVTQSPGVYDSTTASPYITGSGSLLVPSTGPSGPAQLTNSISGSTLTFTWPSGQGWRLESQTNSLTVGLTTNGWSTVSGGIDGSNSITTDPTKPTVFYRLAYP